MKHLKSNNVIQYYAIIYMNSAEISQENRQGSAVYEVLCNFL